MVNSEQLEMYETEQQWCKTYTGMSGINTRPVIWKYNLMFCKYVLKLVLLLPIYLTEIIQAVHYWEYLLFGVYMSQNLLFKYIAPDCCSNEMPTGSL